MKTDSLLHNFNREIECVYEEERYSIRDNGAVLKHPRLDKRPRPTDSQWTFGKPNLKTGYLEIVSVRVHRIVATAFHGIPSTKEHIVDHIDTNKQNNRTENLRWITRLENVMNNPITRKKIEFVIGCDVKEFLANPERFRDRFQEPNFGWMRTVSAAEARACLENMQAWAKTDHEPSGAGPLGEWIYKRQPFQAPYGDITKAPDRIESKTTNAIQRKWRVPSEFPSCPKSYAGAPIKAYAENLKLGSVFCENTYYCSLVLKFALSANEQILYVMTESKNSSIKPWAIAKVEHENGLFVHTSLGSFFKQDGAEKHYSLAQGLEWDGGETFDDQVM